MEAPAATMTRPLIHERETSFDIVVEETVVASAQCLEEALLLFGIAHYVFNQKVSRASRSTMWFIVHDINGAAGRVNSDGGRAEKICRC